MEGKPSEQAPLTDARFNTLAKATLMGLFKR
jgi:hypothetical protein